MVDVKRNNKGATRRPCLYFLLQLHVAQRAHHDVTAVKGRIHQATAKASGNAGYKPGFRSLAVHPQSSLLCVRPQPDAAWLRCQLWSGYLNLRTKFVKGMVHVLPPSPTINIPLTKEASRS